MVSINNKWYQFKSIGYLVRSMVRKTNKTLGEPNLFIVILICFFVLYLFYTYYYDATVYFTDVTYEKTYKVRDTPYKEISVRKLATIDSKLNALVNALKETGDPKVKTLINRWDSGVTIKEIGVMESDAAYVINKRNMSFCLHNDPDPTKNSKETLEDDNLLGYAAIHELAHIMSESIDHGAEFKKNFKFLLNFSKGISYYDHYHKRKLPIYIELSKFNNKSSYCSVNIENTME